MSDTLPSSRPKIEVVRLPSHEQAKLRPLLEGGVQLRAQFQHLRYGDYASYSSLDNGNKQCFRYRARKSKFLFNQNINCIKYLKLMKFFRTVSHWLQSRSISSLSLNVRITLYWKIYMPLYWIYSVSCWFNKPITVFKLYIYVMVRKRFVGNSDIAQKLLNMLALTG